MPESMRQPLWILLIGGIVLFTNLGGPRLWDRDEPRNAGCAAEMLERHDWVVPAFNGELRTHKPVLLYWLMMTAYEVFGVNEFAARFWSAALGLGTLLMTYALGKRLFSPAAGFWSALALCPALMFGVASRAATPDAVLVFCSTLALFLFGMFAFERTAQQQNDFFPQRWWQAALMYAAMGLAILAKGPVGLVLPTAVIGMFLLIMRLPTSTSESPSWFNWLVHLLRPFAPLHFLRTCWRMRPLTAIGIALLVALPWYVWVDYRTAGAWTTGFFFEHNLGRATQAMEGHRGNVLFYPGALAIGFFPWSVFFLPMIVDAVYQIRRRSAATPGYVFAACWVGVYVVLFSLAKTKLPSYVTPCYPAVALLMGAFLSRLTAKETQASTIWLRVGLGISILVGAGILIGLPIASVRLLPGEEWLGVIGLAPLVAGAIGWHFVTKHDYRRMATTYAVGAVAFSTLCFALVAQRIDRHQQADDLLATIYSQHAQPQIGYFRVLEPTWVFYTGQSLTNVRLASDEIHVAPELVPVPGTREWQPREKQLAADFFAAPQRYLITTRRAWASLQHEVPAEVQVLAEVPYFLRSKDQLIAVGRRATTPVVATIPERLERRR